jgi:hypothetical protein
MSDEELRDRPHDYLWLAANGPNRHAGRIALASQTASDNTNYHSVRERMLICQVLAAPFA